MRGTGDVSWSFKCASCLMDPYSRRGGIAWAQLWLSIPWIVWSILWYCMWCSCLTQISLWPCKHHMLFTLKQSQFFSSFLHLHLPSGMQIACLFWRQLWLDCLAEVTHTEWGRSHKNAKAAYLYIVLRHPQKHHCWEGFSVLGFCVRIWQATYSLFRWETQTQSCRKWKSEESTGLLL